MINHTVSIWTIKFNVKQVKQKPLEVCITSKVVGLLEFVILPGYKNINMLLVILFNVNTFTLTVLHSFIYSQKVFFEKVVLKFLVFSGDSL